MAIVSWNHELPVLLFNEERASIKIADEALITKNYPLCLSFTIQIPGVCQIQLRNDDPQLGGEPSTGFPACQYGYLCDVHWVEGQIRTILHKVCNGAIVGSLESAPSSSMTEEGASIWFLVAHGAVIIGTGEIGMNVIQGSFDEEPIPIHSVLYERAALEQSMQFSHIWVGQAGVQGSEEDFQRYVDMLVHMSFLPSDSLCAVRRRRLIDYKNMFDKALKRVNKAIPRLSKALLDPSSPLPPHCLCTGHYLAA